MKHWLVKTEPEVFSFEDLLKAGTSGWDGVRNYQARNMLRDELKKGDKVLVYHSNAEPPAVVGLAVVAREGYPDPTQFDAKHDHYDAGAEKQAPRWFQVDLKAVKKLKRPVSLNEIKADPAFAGMKLVQKGMRLSVQPVSPEHYQRVVKLGSGK